MSDAQTEVMPWPEVEANPEYQKLSPERKESIRTKYFDQVVAPQVPKERLKDVRGKFDQATLPKGQTGVGPVLDRALAAVPSVGTLETGLHMASQLAALPVEAAASLYGAATAPKGLGAHTASANAQAVGEAMTYQPRSASGKTMSGAVDTVMGVVPQLADKATGWIGENPTVKRALGSKGAEYAQAIGNVAIQGGATALGARAGRAVMKGATAAETAAATAARTAERTAAASKAESFVSQNTKLKWDELSDDWKARLTQIAQHAPEELAKIKPTALERQVRLDKLKVPGTRGEVERDRGDIAHEKLLAESPSGKPLREISGRQDTALHEAVAEVRKDTGAKAVTRQQVGESVEGALRGAESDKAAGLGSKAKEVWSKANYDEKYKVARETEPNATVQPGGLFDLLKKNPHIQRLGWVDSWLKRGKVKLAEEEGEKAPGLVDASGKPFKEPQYRGVKLDELDDLRKDATAIRAKGGPEAHYADQVVKEIDKAMEKIPAAAKAWRAAYATFKAHKIEFEDQKLVRDLTEMDTRTDPKTALEKTGDKVLSASAADIVKLKKTLTKGGTEATRAAGAQAWKDIQGAVLDALRDKATGKRSIPGEDEQLPFDSSFRDLFNELEADGKIDALFEPKQAARLREINKAVADVRTTAKTRIPGSPTAANLRAERERAGQKVLGKLAKTPKILGGKYVAGAAAGLKSIGAKGAEVRDVAEAQASRLDEAAAKAAKKQARKRSATTRRNVLKSIPAGAGVIHRATLQDDDRRKNAEQ